MVLEFFFLFSHTNGTNVFDSFMMIKMISHFYDASILELFTYVGWHRSRVKCEHRFGITLKKKQFLSTKSKEQHYKLKQTKINTNVRGGGTPSSRLSALKFFSIFKKLLTVQSKQSFCFRSRSWRIGRKVERQRKERGVDEGKSPSYINYVFIYNICNLFTIIYVYFKFYFCSLVSVEKMLFIIIISDHFLSDTRKSGSIFTKKSPFPWIDPPDN